MTEYEAVLGEHLARYAALAPCAESVRAAAALLIAAFRAGGKLLVCGNGGSAADGGHIAGELMKSFRRPRPLSESYAARLREGYGEDGARLARRLEGGLPVIALSAHTALTTAVANDTDPALIFAQQVAALGRPGDVLWALSTSGSSENCVLAATAARAAGMRVLAMTGEGGGRLAPLADVTVAVPARETYQVQEYHLPIYHALCAAVEAAFWS